MDSDRDIDMVIEYVFGALPPEMVEQIEERASIDTIFWR